MLVGFVSLMPDLIWRLVGHFSGGEVLCKIVKFSQVSKAEQFTNNYFSVLLQHNTSKTSIYNETNNYLMKTYLYIDSSSVARGLRYFSTQESKILNLTLESGDIS